MDVILTIAISFIIGSVIVILIAKGENEDKRDGDGK